MSLKAFHIIFVCASTLLALGFGGWALHGYLHGEGSTGLLVTAIGSFLLAIGLVIYGRYVLKKLRNVSFL